MSRVQCGIQPFYAHPRDSREHHGAIGLDHPFVRDLEEIQNNVPFVNALVLPVYLSLAGDWRRARFFSIHKVQSHCQMDCSVKLVTLNLMAP